MLIAINRTDGGVSIMQLADDADPEVEIAKWVQACRGTYAYVSHHEISEADVPRDRTYRNAWASEAMAIVHDMGKARDIHRELMRRARAPRLASLDVAYQRADEARDDAAKAEIAAQKQALRDATDDPRIDAAQTPAELKAVWPEVLGVTTPSR